MIRPLVLFVFVSQIHVSVCVASHVQVYMCVHARISVYQYMCVTYVCAHWDWKLALLQVGPQEMELCLRCLLSHYHFQKPLHKKGF